MAKINSKEKGKRFEHELASLLREYGYEARRTAQYCGKSEDSADVVGLPFIHIEAKHQEKMCLRDWMDQAKRDSAGTGKIPAVFHKQNRCSILVTLNFDDFMTIYREWEAGMSQKIDEMEKDKI
jgi:hypothetical protein